MKIEFYGIAWRNGKPAQQVLIYEGGIRVSCEFTGVVYADDETAIADIAKLNRR